MATTTYTDAQLLVNVRAAIYAATNTHTGTDGTVRPPAVSYMIAGRSFTVVGLDKLRKLEQTLQNKISAANSSRAAAGVEFRTPVA